MCKYNKEALWFCKNEMQKEIYCGDLHESIKIVLYDN